MENSLKGKSLSLLMGITMEYPPILTDSNLEELSFTKQKNYKTGTLGLFIAC